MRNPEIAWVVLVSLLASALLTFVARWLALTRGVLDVPNERSSHRVPTARGGGIAIVVTATAGWLALAAMDLVRMDLAVALAAGGVTVALVGLIDDYRGMSIRVRLIVHFAAALWALMWLDDMPILNGESGLALRLAGYALAAIAIVWSINLFNFMDGIDGIAASEAIFISGAGAFLAVAFGMGGGVAAAALVFGAACCGFLLWNWPPAKIFMGDVGSGYLGFVAAVLAFAATRESAPAFYAWLVLGAVFFVDASITLLIRLVRGEKVYQAHRAHAYQALSRRWGHGRVTTGVWVVNLSFLLPLAYVATAYPQHAGWLVVVAWVPLAVFANVAGAGRSARDGS